MQLFSETRDRESWAKMESLIDECEWKGCKFKKLEGAWRLSSFWRVPVVITDHPHRRRDDKLIHFGKMGTVNCPYANKTCSTSRENQYPKNNTHGTEIPHYLREIAPRDNFNWGYLTGGAPWPLDVWTTE